MASDDLKKVTELMFKKRFKVKKTKFEYHREPTEETKMTITIEDNCGNEICLESLEDDFVEFGLHLRKIGTPSGDYALLPIKNVEKMYKDVDFLYDPKNEKLDAAMRNVLNGEFKPPQNFDFNAQLKKLLFSKRRSKNGVFLKLKENYFEWLAINLLISKKYLDLWNRIIANKEKGEYATLCERLLKIYASIGVPIKDYIQFHSSTSLDFTEIAKKGEEESEHIEWMLKGLAQRSPVEPLHSIKQVLTMYTKLCELSKPLVKAMKVALQKTRGATASKRELSFIENVEILKKDSEFCKLVDCIDPHIRNNESHLSTEIDVKNMKIKLWNKKKTKVVREYTLRELFNMTLQLRNAAFPSILVSFVMADLALLNLALLSPEYKCLLLSIGNS